MSSIQELSGALRDFALAVVTDCQVQDILDYVVGLAVDVLPVAAAGATLMTPGAGHRYLASSSEPALVLGKLQSESRDGPAEEAWRSGRTVLLPDLREEARFPAFSHCAVELGLASAFTFPLANDNRVLGALDLYRDVPGYLSASTMESSETVAEVTAAYLVNAETRADLQESSERARRAALHDPLTGLPNRVLLLERLEHAFARARRSGRSPAVLFVDLDRFKEINDTYGHRTGDKLLAAVAERLSGALRTGDTLGRMSGDEFVVVCEDVAFPADADRIVGRLAAALALPFVLGGVEVDVTASIGVAMPDSTETDPEQLLHDADHAMYQSKRRRSGGRRIFDFREGYLDEHQSGLRHDLAGVLEREELRLEYQPIVDSGAGDVVGVEALVRWDHPTAGTVPPRVLMALAERSGSMEPIGRWVLDLAWSDRSRWASRRRAAANGATRDLAMSVNVSAHQLMSPGFAETVAAVLSATTSKPRLLNLEVSETVFVRDRDRTMSVLGDLKDIGVTVALDNFGTGCTSLDCLQHFPVDIVKIDRSFVADLDRSRSTHTIVAAIVKLAHDLRMTVVAEGVETAEQHQTLAQLGCDHYQGYYFARPRPAPELDALILGDGINRPTGASS